METETRRENAERRAAGATGTGMQVRKRNGSFESVDLNKIVRAIQRSGEGLARVDTMRVATRTVSGLYDGASTRELDQLSIQTSASLITEEPEYGRLAARLLGTYIDKEVQSFSQSIARGREVGLIGERVSSFVQINARKLNDAIDSDRTRLFEYFGLRTLYDRYLLKHPERRDVLETPQYFFLRIACALSENVPDAIEMYRLFSTLEYLPSSPTLSTPARATSSSQAASCSTRPKTTSRTSTSATPTLRCSRCSRAASASRTTACVRAARSSRAPTVRATASCPGFARWIRRSPQ